MNLKDYQSPNDWDSAFRDLKHRMVSSMTSIGSFPFTPGMIICRMLIVLRMFSSLDLLLPDSPETSLLSLPQLDPASSSTSEHRCGLAVVAVCMNDRTSWPPSNSLCLLVGPAELSTSSPLSSKHSCPS
nr:hypothetical protein Iba_chr14dCG17920 [Ipomoea batatas]